MKFCKSNHKALILAAGLGSRLAPVTNDKPKSLVPVNGKPILFKQIENLRNNGIMDILIVSGYKADILERSVKEKWDSIKIIKSADYAETNNMFSAYIGMKEMFPNGKISPFYMMNADVFYDESVIAGLESNPDDNLIAVDPGRYIAESMKITQRDGRIVSISKEIARQDAFGCSIDVYKFGEDGGRAFFDCCAYYIEERKQLKLWSEAAINDALEKAVFKVCPLRGRWMEIDNLDDLAAAEGLFA